MSDKLNRLNKLLGNPPTEEVTDPQTQVGLSVSPTLGQSTLDAIFGKAEGGKAFADPRKQEAGLSDVGMLNPIDYVAPALPGIAKTLGKASMGTAPALKQLALDEAGTLKLPIKQEAPMTVDEFKNYVSKLPKGELPTNVGDIAPPLDMSEATRLARAKEMGFDTGKTWYHGTTGDISEFDPKALGLNTYANSAKKGFFFASEPETASSYALGGVNRGDLEIKRVYSEAVPKEDALKVALKDLEIKERGSPDYAQKRNSIEQALQKLRDETREKLGAIESKYSTKDAYDKEVNELESRYNDAVAGLSRRSLTKDAYDAELGNINAEHIKNIAALIDRFNGHGKYGANILSTHLRMKNPFIKDYKGGTYRDEPYSKVIQEALDKGHDGVILKNTRDSMGGEQPLTDVAVVFDPSQIRSKFAEFDPTKKDLADLSAGVAALPGLGALLKKSKEE